MTTPTAPKTMLMVGETLEVFARKAGSVQLISFEPGIMYTIHTMKSAAYATIVNTIPTQTRFLLRRDEENIWRKRTSKEILIREAAQLYAAVIAQVCYSGRVSTNVFITRTRGYYFPTFISSTVMLLSGMFHMWRPFISSRTIVLSAARPSMATQECLPSANMTPQKAALAHWRDIFQQHD